VAARLRVSSALLFRASALAANARVHTTLVAHEAFTFTRFQAIAVVVARGSIFRVTLRKIDGVIFGQLLRVDSERKSGQQNSEYHTAHGRSRRKGISESATKRTASSMRWIADHWCALLF
jgi:hypothetical protein